MYFMNYKLLGVGRDGERRNRLMLADLLNFFQNYFSGFYTQKFLWGVPPSCRHLISHSNSCWLSGNLLLELLEAKLFVGCVARDVGSGAEVSDTLYCLFLCPAHPLFPGYISFTAHGGMLLSGESLTEIWKLPLKTDDLETCCKKGLISLTGKTDRGGQRREEYFLNTAQQQLNGFLKVMKETCVPVRNLTQIFCLVHCLSSWMPLPASLVTDIGHCKVRFPSPYLEKVVTGGGLTEIHDQCKKRVFPSPLCCCSTSCEFREVCSSSGFLSSPHRKSHKSSLCKSVFF